MAIVEHPKSDLPGKLVGLHLFHSGPAPCAQRVRFVLAEKGIRRGRDVRWDSDAPETLVAEPGSYVSRPLSLPRKENLTAAWAAIHPNMVVPALVHDGVLHIESADLMSYVDAHFPGPSLVPEGAAGALCGELVSRAKALHRAVRFMTYRFSLGRLAKLSPAELASLRGLERVDSPEQLATFYRDFSTDAIAEEIYQGHLRDLEQGFAELEARLASDGRAFLTGPDFSLADVIWSVKLLRIRDCGYPFAERFPQLDAWFGRVRARPSFREAIWRDVRGISHVLRAKAALDGLRGRGIAQLSREAERASA